MQVIQACREAVVEVKYRRENEVLLRREVDELRKSNTTKDERIGHLEAATNKYEQAVTAREEAEKLYNDLRIIHAKEMAVVEKQLARSEAKVTFWKTMTKVGVVIGVAVGAAVGYSVGSR